MPGAAGAPEETLEKLAQQMNATREGFIEAMNEDFNTAGALGNLFDLVRAINQARSENATDEELAEAQETMDELTGVFGLEMNTDQKGATGADAFIELLLELRQELRQKKHYDLADRVRDELAELGVVIEDTPQGSSWHWE
jgi:cysteinyl-tRNA synthetase